MAIHAGTGMDPLEAAQLSRWDLYQRIKELEAEVERLSLLAQKPRENDPNYWPKCGHLPHAGTCYEPPEVARKERDDG